MRFLHIAHKRCGSLRFFKAGDDPLPWGRGGRRNPRHARREPCDAAVREFPSAFAVTLAGVVLVVPYAVARGLVATSAEIGWASEAAPEVLVAAAAKSIRLAP